METGTIPNIRLENIGTRQKPIYVIRGFVELSTWTGYFLTEEPNYLIKTKAVTDGKIGLWVDGEITGESKFNIGPEQNNAYLYLLEHSEKIKHCIIENLKKEFPRLLSEEYASWDPEEGYLPRLSDLTPDFDFKNYIGPSSITIREESKEEVAYLQWHFECLWDSEHGFDVITHKERVIDVSPDADIFKINKDNGTYEELEKELENKVWKKPVPKKKWWQFW